MKSFVARGEDLRLGAVSRPRLRGSFIRLSDGVTHYELKGPAVGDLVILTGGLTIPLFYWDQVLPALHEAGLRTLTYSGYGRGYSDRVAGPYNEDLFVRQLAELVGALGLPGRHHIVGSSMGALTAMGYVLRNVRSVATLTVAGPAGLGPKPAALRLLLSNDLLAGVVARRLGRRWLDSHEAQNLGDQTRAAELSAMLQDAFRYEGSLHALFDTLQNFGLFERANLYRATGGLGVPTQLIWGRDDRVTPIDKLDTARALLRPERHFVLECGHMTPFERPRQVAGLIAAFAAPQTHRTLS